MRSLVTFSILLGSIIFHTHLKAESQMPSSKVCNQRDSRELCLRNNRFGVKFFYLMNDSWQLGRSLRESSDVGYFKFSNGTDIKAIVKILYFPKGKRFAPYWDALSDLPLRLEIRDYKTGKLTRLKKHGERPSCRQDKSIWSSTQAPFELDIGRPCKGGEHQLCLGGRTGRRFAIDVDWKVPQKGPAIGKAHARGFRQDMGKFWFFNQKNTELIVRVLEKRNNHFEIAYGVATDLEFSLRVRDTKTGVVKRYKNFRGTSCGRKDILTMNPSALQGGATSGPYPEGPNCRTGEGHCVCPRELGYLLEGRPNINKRLFRKHQHPGNDDPKNFFVSQGSLNIGVICRAGDYALNPEAQREWFDEYFDLQFDKKIYKAKGGKPIPKGIHIGFMGSEFLSPLYSPLTVSGVMTVYHYALKNNDRPLAKKAAKWLKTYWALLSLGTKKVRVKRYDIVRSDGIRKQKVSNPDNLLAVGLAGARHDKEAYITKGLNDIFLAQALGIKPRKFQGNVNGAPTVMGAAKIIGLLLGDKIRYRGKKGFLTKYHIDSPAGHFGLTEDERRHLSGFIDSNGAKYAKESGEMLRGVYTRCHYTFLRSQKSLTTFFGTRDHSQGTCNRNKGPYYIGQVNSNGVVTLVAPSVNVPAEMGESYVEGNQVCAHVKVGSGITKCLDLPDQNEIIYEFKFGPHGPFGPELRDLPEPY
ncbi:MAG: hypothetical protein OXB88_04100 [Bacteriovoracales bacterium]|nr:hypothetical protein [Bacteriovoracales bacterium]